MREAQVLQFIKTYSDEQGYAPSLRNIADAVGVTSTSTVANQIRNLKKKGRITHHPLRSRTYQVVPDSKTPDTTQDEPKIPLCSLLVTNSSTEETPSTVFVLQVMLAPAVGNALLNGALLTVQQSPPPGPDAPTRIDHATLLGQVVAVTHPL
ncbi:LexA family protein [Streptomyces sp. NPDC002514]|uniref:LexA family protein n=1 Tax=Streptomyces sp. NPDC001270 TaxID=3364554 RepID=UPI0036866A89